MQITVIEKTVDITTGYIEYCRFVNSNGYSANISLIYSPFGNCQNFSIAYFNNILSTFSNEDVTKAVQICSARVDKHLLLIDVATIYTVRIEKIFTNIVFKNDYVSTNNSYMTIFMIKI